MTETFTLYKLIILYMLQRVDFPLTNSQISEFILDKGYTTYFKLQQALSELLDANLIQEENIHKRTLYQLTEEGNQSILFFRNKISKPILEDIDHYLKEKQLELKNEASIKANYFLNTNHEYSVQCQVIENSVPLIDLTVAVPTEEAAEHVVNNWNRNNQEIYALIMAKLL